MTKDGSILHVRLYIALVIDYSIATMYMQLVCSDCNSNVKKMKSRSLTYMRILFPYVQQMLFHQHQQMLRLEMK